MKAINVLMLEHREIERVLASLEVLADQVERGAAPGALTGFVEFFRGYADAHHHGKEEHILFPSLHRCGMSLEAGPLAVMLFDHVEGRRLVGLLADGACAAALDAAGRQELARTARRYAAFLRHHIYKEDTVLFSMAEQQLAPSECKRVDAESAAFEKLHPADAWLERAQKLVTEFPADERERDGGQPVGNGCDLHCTLAGCAIRDPFGELPWHEGA